jgi:hypothetical protein
MYTLPFLYLPDAISLILILAALSMLRKVAIHHLCQELLIIRKQLLAFWLDNGLDHNDPGYKALRDLVDSAIRVAPKLSPGRLLFLYRLARKPEAGGLLPNPAREASRLIACTPNANGRKKLERLQLEMNLGLGTFFLAGSLSGWFLMCIIGFQLTRRTISHYQDDRTDAFFDMAERVLVRLGRRAQQIGLAASA